MNFLQWTNFTMERPTAYGWFHLMFLALTFISCVFVIVFGRKNSLKTVNRVVFAFGIFLAIIETYKQLFFTYINYGGVYSVYNFPFQFCSVPIYVCLFAPFIKNEKVQNWFYNFLALYALLAGLTVMFYPGDVFSTQGSISIHSMLWHSSMVIIGVYIITSRQIGKSFKEVLRGYSVFLGFVFVALFGFDIALYKLLNTHINMFYVSPYYITTMTVFNTIQTNCGWTVMFLSYLFGFFLGAVIIWSFAKLIMFVRNKIKNKGIKKLI